LIQGADNGWKIVGRNETEGRMQLKLDYGRGGFNLWGLGGRGPPRSFPRRVAKLNRGVELSPAYIDVA